MRTLQLLLDNPRDSHRFFLMAGNGTRGRNPRCSSWTSDGSAHTRRAFAAWLIAKTMAHQMSDAVKQASSLFQHAQRISHALQGLTELDHQWFHHSHHVVALCNCTMDPTTTKKQKENLVQEALVAGVLHLQIWMAQKRHTCSLLSVRGPFGSSLHHRCCIVCLGNALQHSTS